MTSARFPREAPPQVYAEVDAGPRGIDVDEIQAHLPEEPNSFIGRERELGELSQLLTRTRALTLCGPGGIGKTRLALRLLSVVSGEGSAAGEEFPDGVWFVELADLRQPDQVASRIAAVTGIAEEAGRPLLETLGEALRPRRMLLALDNCEHLLDACAQVCRHVLASAPGLRLLNTSREPLSVAAETIWRVPPLSVAPAGVDPAAAAPGAERYEAVRLFADRAAASRPGFSVGRDNIAAVASICRALDGMPLAIELAAARVRALSVEQIAARLDDRFGLLTTGDRSAAPRQRTLRNAIEWSYDLLTEPERALFRRLAAFTGWSLEMAEEVCAGEGITAADVLGLTAALVDKSLVVLGTFGEGGEWLRSLLALDLSAVPAWVQGAATVVRGQLALSSDPAAAWSLATDGLKLCRDAGDGYWTAVALNLLAQTALHTGRIDEATASADEALSIAQAAGDGWNEGYALGTRAAIAARRGQLRESEQLATASVAVMRRIDQQWGAARALSGLGVLARFRKPQGEALGGVG